MFHGKPQPRRLSAEAQTKIDQQAPCRTVHAPVGKAPGAGRAAQRRHPHHRETQRRRSYA